MRFCKLSHPFESHTIIVVVVVIVDSTRPPFASQPKRAANHGWPLVQPLLCLKSSFPEEWASCLVSVKVFSWGSGNGPRALNIDHFKGCNVPVDYTIGINQVFWKTLDPTQQWYICPVLLPRLFRPFKRNHVTPITRMFWRIQANISVLCWNTWFIVALLSRDNWLKCNQALLVRNQLSHL